MSGFAAEYSKKEALKQEFRRIRAAYEKAGVRKLTQLQYEVPTIVRDAALITLTASEWQQITPVQWSHLENAVISCYLRSWLRKDSTAQQNIRSFCRSPFNLEHSEADSDCSWDDFENNYRNFWNNGFERCFRLLSARQEQAKAEGTVTLPLPKRGRSEWEIPLSFIDLAFAEALQWGALDLLKMATESKICLKNTTDHGSNLTLKTACDRLSQYAKKIQTIGQDLSLCGITECRHYVSSCMMICEFEESYRFALVSKLAFKAIQEKSLWKKVKSSGNPPLPFLFWGRYCDNSEPFQRQTGNQIVVEDWHRNLLNYDHEINAVFHNDINLVTVNWKLRNVLHNALIYLLVMFPIDQQGAWTNEDYYAAAEFYRVDFPIMDMIVNLDLPELEPDCGTINTERRKRRKKDYYDLFRSIFVEWMLYNGSPLEGFRKSNRK